MKDNVAAFSPLTQLALTPRSVSRCFKPTQLYEQSLYREMSTLTPCYPSVFVLRHFTSDECG